jgi:pseudouridylate synthase
LAFVIAQNGNGSTTVAATMYLANLAGIKIFVTGGIGGVHRGAEQTFDISADLTELSRTPVSVICAGVKSILDIPKTLEFLETMGVPVVSYRTEWFPDFFTSNSGIKSVFRADSPEECAGIILGNEILKLKNGIIFAVPVPSDKEANQENIQAAISQALKEADDKGVKGALITPFLLKRVNELTGGESSASSKLTGLKQCYRC